MVGGTPEDAGCDYRPTRRLRRRREGHARLRRARCVRYAPPHHRQPHVDAGVNAMRRGSGFTSIPTRLLYLTRPDPHPPGRVDSIADRPSISDRSVDR
ncbi:hypothetical protein NL676_008027 [Syzygium grande]|nr:hypothetical protein NL676_008027 [Syzygium grande]